jgi:hypothetical protein
LCCANGVIASIPCRPNTQKSAIVRAASNHAGLYWPRNRGMQVAVVMSDGRAIGGVDASGIQNVGRHRDGGGGSVDDMNAVVHPGESAASVYGTEAPKQGVLVRTASRNLDVVSFDSDIEARMSGSWWGR